MIFDFDTAEAVAQMAEQPASMFEMGDLAPSEPASPTAPTTPMRVNLREPSARTLPRTKTLSGVTLPRHASVSLSRSTSGEVAVTSKRPRAYHVGALSVVAYIAALFFLLAVSLGYTLLDIVISHKVRAGRRALGTSADSSPL